jgi:hypothetical protein
MEHLFDQAQAQRKSIVEPNSVSDDLQWETMALIADRLVHTVINRRDMLNKVTVTSPLAGIELIHMICKRRARYAYSPSPSNAEQFTILAA